MKLNLRQMMFVTALGAAMMMGCSSSPTGTYTDASGAFVLQLKSGGAATFSFSGDSANCTYKTQGKACEGQAGPLVLTIQSDGSLTGPPGTFMPPLKKK